MDVNSQELCITAGQTYKIYITFIVVMRGQRVGSKHRWPTCK